MDVTELGAPADEVVGEDGTGQPGRVGEEVARGAVLEPRSFFEFTDGELDAGMARRKTSASTVSKAVSVTKAW